MNKWHRLIREEDSELYVQEKEKSRWLPFTSVKHPVNRTIARNEICFDVDGKTSESTIQLLHNLEHMLTRLDIPFIRTTSGHWFHVHVFWDESTSVPISMLTSYYYKEPISTRKMQYFLKKMRDGIFFYLVDCVKPVEDAEFDSAVMTASRHMIRCIGAVNTKTGFVKSVLDEKPDKIVLVKKKDVVYPERINHWKIPDSLLWTVYRRYIKKRRIHIPNDSPNKINWIESLFDHPLPDERKRVVGLIFAPYLTTIRGFSEENAVDRIMGWLIRCKEIRSTSLIESDVRSSVRYSKNSQRKPLSKENLFKFGLKEVSKVVA